MKFKIYGWNTIFKQDDYYSIHFHFLPEIELSKNYQNFEPDENFPYRRKGWNCYLVFTWLFWGFTIDLRTGIYTGGKK